MSYSSIIIFYHKSRNHKKAIYIDLLEDIMHSHSVFNESMSGIKKGLNQARKAYNSQAKDLHNISGDIKGIIAYKKTTGFNENLLKQFPCINENELTFIRGERYRFFQLLIKEDILTISKELENKDHGNLLDDIDSLGVGLKAFTKIDKKGKISVSFDKIKQDGGKLTIGRRTYYIQDPNNFVIFLSIHVLKGIVEIYGVPSFNRILRAYLSGELEDEDEEILIFSGDIGKIEKLKHILETGDDKGTITKIDLRKGKLHINNNEKNFQLGKNATSAKAVLEFLCFYFEENMCKTPSEGDLKAYYKRTKERFPMIKEKSITMEGLRTGFLVTFETALLKIYSQNNIFEKDSSHLVLNEKIL